jgi:uncharacterized protein
MPENLTLGQIAAAAGQLVLLIIGAVIVWRLRFGRAAKAAIKDRLPPWAISGFDFALICFAVLVGGLVGQVTLAYLGRLLIGPMDQDLELIVNGAAFQLGLLGGVAVGAALMRQRDPAPPPLPMAGSVFVAGAASFAAALPLLLLVNVPWTLLLERLGFPTDKQDLVLLFANADSPALIVVVMILAVIVAPLAEELIFRAGLFRFLRGRVPRPIALALPAVIFGALHGNVAAFAPLVTLGVIFALAYERTGRIAVPIVAHALFNFNTIVLLLAGVTV